MNFLRALFVLLVVIISSPALAEVPPTTVGVILPLSGEVASMGQAFRRGLDLFVKDYPQSSIKLVFEDHRYDGKSALSALHKLRQVDKVALEIVWGNMPGDSCAPVAEQEKIPLIAISMNPVAKDRKYVVSLGPPTDKLLTKVGERLAEWNTQNAAAISIDIGNALQALEQLKVRMHGALAIKTIANEESDFKTMILALKKKKVDSLFLLMLPKQALTFLRQAKQLDFHPRIIGGDVFADMNFQKEALQYTDSLYYVYGATDEAFIARLKNEFGDTSYFFEAASGYSLGRILDRAAEKARTEEPHDIFSQLGKIDTAGMPLGGLNLLRTPDYGLHFETDGSIYRAQQ